MTLGRGVVLFSVPGNMDDIVPNLFNLVFYNVRTIVTLL